MAMNIIVRTASKQYVCDCCGHLIKSGETYLDKVTFEEGRCVKHLRYHYECPIKDDALLLFNKIFNDHYNLIVAYQGYKYHAIGISNGNVVLKAWIKNYDSKDNTIKGITNVFEVPIKEFLANYYNEYGERIV
jgi:hypothetical protein